LGWRPSSSCSTEEVILPESVDVEATGKFAGDWCCGDGPRMAVGGGKRLNFAMRGEMLIYRGKKGENTA